MSESQPKLPIGARVRLMNTTLMEKHGLGGSIGEVVPIRDGLHIHSMDAVAVRLLTGPRAYDEIIIPASSVSRHPGACYWCPHASHMNDRDQVRCQIHDRINASGGTCEVRTKELAIT